MVTCIYKVNLQLKKILNMKYEIIEMLTVLGMPSVLWLGLDQFLQEVLVI